MLSAAFYSVYGRTFQREHEVIECIRILLVRLGIVLICIGLNGKFDEVDGPLDTLK